MDEVGTCKNRPYRLYKLCPPPFTNCQDVDEWFWILTVSSSCSSVFLDSCSESLKFVATNYLFKPTHTKILQVWLNLDPVFATNTGRSFSVGLSDTGVSASLNSKTWQKRLIDSDWPVDLEDLSGKSPMKNIFRCRVLLGTSEIFQPSMFDYRRVSWLIPCIDEFWLWLPSPTIRVMILSISWDGLESPTNPIERSEIPLSIPLSIPYPINIPWHMESQKGYG